MRVQGKSRIRVLIVEDSPLIQQLLIRILTQDEAFEVVGAVADGASALQAVENLRPDVVTMDIQIKQANGLDVTRRIMETSPVPIVVISASCTPGDSQKLMEIMEAGALTALPKPPGTSHPEFSKHSASLRQTMKDMSAVKVVRRRSRLPVTSEPVALSPVKEGSYKILSIGASAGGPSAVLELLTGLSIPFPLPILLVQHIYPGFACGLVEWLSCKTRFAVKLLEHDTVARPGTVYLCENGYQMGIRADGTISVIKTELEYGHCPSVAHLFASLVGSYGPSSIGVLLSGMGNDGVEQLKLMRNAGALTIAQDVETALVRGMPGEAQRIGAAEVSVSPAQAAVLINRALGIGS